MPAPRPEAPPAGEPAKPPLRERLRRVAAVVGYVSFYAILALTFVAALVKGLGSWWAVSGYVVLGGGVLSGVAMNLKGAALLVRARRTQAGMSVALAVASGTAILVVANWLGYRWHFRVDVTEEKRFTLSPKTLSLLDRLDRAGRELRVVTFLPFRFAPGRGIPDDLRSEVVELLRLYEERSRRIRVTHTSVADPARSREAADELGFPPGRSPAEAVVLKYGRRRRDVGVLEIFQLVQVRQGLTPEPVFRGEDVLSSAIRELLDDRPKKLCVVTGHGERSAGNAPRDYGPVLSRVEGMGFQIEAVDVAEREGVPGDCDCLLVAGPTRSFLAGAGVFDEVAAVRGYLANGGSLLYLADNSLTNPGQRPSGLEPLLEEYGVKVRADALAAGPELRYANATQALPLKTHVATAPLAEAGLPVWMYRAACLEETTPAEGARVSQRILEGSRGSWGERKLSGDSVYDPGEDIAGPVALAVASWTRGAEEKGAKLVVAADADFLSTQLIADRLYLESGNLDFLLNSVEWLAGRAENVGIEPRRYRKLVADVRPDDRLPLLVGTVLGPALVMVAAGLLVRRARSR